jgi:membrane protease YdiL (CAAX protease family)
MTHPARSPATKPLDALPTSVPALILFGIISFGWAWSLWTTGVAVTAQAPAWSRVLLILAGFGPSLAALLTVLIFVGWQGLGLWLRRCLVWRLGLSVYLLALISPLAVMITALGMDAAWSGVWPPLPAAGHIGAFALQSALILVIGGPLGEEFGWRGYALPALTTRFGWRIAALSVGAVWGLWHLPLFYLPGMAQAQMPMALFMASSLALSVVMARMTVGARFSILPALMFHWAINGWSGLVPILPVNGHVRPYALAMGILFIAALVVLAKPGPPSDWSAPE